MNHQVTSIEAIRRQAREAAERGEPISFCQYDQDSPAGRQWRAAYWERELDLSGEATV